ncbi:hypothetical protein FOPG_12997 [Fusarium oxysporum f. sp. conglutinans race 2 54008]|uniref:Uncharacterized protein n=2 Tax=Fusarium oxysporum f. sp. conglutinans TaxID=100902 RepID=F9F887_FUSOF|nr:hypothetical protein FOXB_02612 [Fusarium oxysporum f. sp. conglutinans Fo5176]EXL71267.1 hypothetical protein FOPG_12997 [Fusarium oxysporum f. sp. conglutinans race 2 54008]
MSRSTLVTGPIVVQAVQDCLSSNFTMFAVIRNVFALFQAAQKVVYSSVDRGASDQSCGFFNDVAPSFEAKAFTTSFRDAKKDKLLECIAIPDIGVPAAEGFIYVIDST